MRVSPASKNTARMRLSRRGRAAGALSGCRAGAFLAGPNLRVWDLLGDHSGVSVAIRQASAQSVERWYGGRRAWWGRVCVGEVHLFEFVSRGDGYGEDGQAYHVALQLVVGLHYDQGRHSEGALDQVEH